MLTLFDHVNAIYTNQDVDYFDNLDESDKKTLNPFMVNRVISMIPDQIPVVNIFQQYLGQLGPRESYLFYSQCLAKGKRNYRYIKGAKEAKYEPWVVELVAQYYKISKSEAIYYLGIMMKTAEGKTELKRVLAAYGTDEKKIKSLKLEDK